MKNYLFIISLLLSASVSSSAFAENANTSNDATPKTSKIVGGVKSATGAWPSTVALLNVTKADTVGNYQAQFCGGSMIGEKWVLTAAHCVVNSDNGVVDDPGSIYALVGATNLENEGEKITVKRVVVYPAYDHNSDDSDLALLELDYTPFSFIPKLSISVNDAPINLLATSVGWGELEYQGSNLYPVNLREVNVPIVSHARCESIYGSDLFTSNMICAGYSQGGKDTCRSDSGGPLMGIQHSEYVQIGVTSWGVNCAKPNLYGVYTRLSNFESWIKSYTNNNSYPSGGLSSWSRFYSPRSSSGGSLEGLLPFLLLLSGLTGLKRFKRNEV